MEEINLKKKKKTFLGLIRDCVCSIELITIHEKLINTYPLCIPSMLFYPSITCKEKEALF